MSLPAAGSSVFRKEGGRRDAGNKINAKEGMKYENSINNRRK